MIRRPPRSTLFPLHDALPIYDHRHRPPAREADRRRRRRRRRQGSRRGPPDPWSRGGRPPPERPRSEEHTSELQSRQYLVCRLLLEKKKTIPLPLTDPVLSFAI